MIVEISKSPERRWNAGNLLAQVFSFETVFVLYLFAGLFKGDPRLAWVPIDITLLLLLTSVIAGGFVLVQTGLSLNQQTLTQILIGLGFFVWTVGSLMWSDSVVYGPAKAQDMGILVFWCFMATTLIVSQSQIRFFRFVAAIFALSVVFAVTGYLTPANTSGFVEVYGSNYLGLSFITGSGSVIVFFFIVRTLSGRTLLPIIPLGLLLGLFSVVQLQAGGRGPLISTAIALLVMLLAVILRREINISLNRGIGLLALGLVVVIALVFMPSTQSEQTQTLRRLNLAIAGENGSSVGDRLSRYTTSIELFGERPIFGYGIGAWPIHALSSDEHAYPHNIFLEIAVEYGAVGLLLFIAFLVVTAYIYLKNPSAEALLWLGLVILAFVAAQTSGDLSDNRRLFAFIGLAGVLLQSNGINLAAKPRLSKER